MSDFEKVFLGKVFSRYYLHRKFSFQLRLTIYKQFSNLSSKVMSSIESHSETIGQTDAWIPIIVLRTPDGWWSKEVCPIHPRGWKIPGGSAHPWHYTRVRCPVVEAWWTSAKSSQLPASWAPGKWKKAPLRAGWVEACVLRAWKSDFRKPKYFPQ